MLTALPKWYMEAREKLKKLVIDIAIKNKIDHTFVSDSKTIQDSIDAITMRLTQLPVDKDLVSLEKHFKKGIKKKKPEEKKASRIEPKKETPKEKTSVIGRPKILDESATIEIIREFGPIMAKDIVIRLKDSGKSVHRNTLWKGLKKLRDEKIISSKGGTFNKTFFMFNVEEEKTPGAKKHHGLYKDIEDNIFSVIEKHPGIMALQIMRELNKNNIRASKDKVHSSLKELFKEKRIKKTSAKRYVKYFSKEYVEEHPDAIKKTEKPKPIKYIPKKTPKEEKFKKLKKMHGHFKDIEDDVIKLINENHGISVLVLIEKLKVGDSKIQRTLKKLIEDGKIKKHGKRRHIKYYPKEYEIPEEVNPLKETKPSKTATEIRKEERREKIESFFEPVLSILKENPGIGQAEILRRRGDDLIGINRDLLVAVLEELYGNEKILKIGAKAGLKYILPDDLEEFERKKEEQKPPPKKEIVIKCPECDSENCEKSNFYMHKKTKFQVHLCKECNKEFVPGYDIKYPDEELKNKCLMVFKKIPVYPKGKIISSFNVPGLNKEELDKILEVLFEKYLIGVKGGSYFTKHGMGTFNEKFQPYLVSMKEYEPAKDLTTESVKKYIEDNPGCSMDDMCMHFFNEEGMHTRAYRIITGRLQIMRAHEILKSEVIPDTNRKKKYFIVKAVQDRSKSTIARGFGESPSQKLKKIEKAEENDRRLGLTYDEKKKLCQFILHYLKKPDDERFFSYKEMERLMVVEDTTAVFSAMRDSGPNPLKNFIEKEIGKKLHWSTSESDGKTFIMVQPLEVPNE